MLNPIASAMLAETFEKTCPTWLLGEAAFERHFVVTLRWIHFYVHLLGTYQIYLYCFLFEVFLKQMWIIYMHYSFYGIYCMYLFVSLDLFWGE